MREIEREKAGHISLRREQQSEPHLESVVLILAY